MEVSPKKIMTPDSVFSTHFYPTRNNGLNFYPATGGAREKTRNQAGYYRKSLFGDFTLNAKKHIQDTPKSRKQYRRRVRSLKIDLTWYCGGLATAVTRVNNFFS